MRIWPQPRDMNPTSGLEIWIRPQPRDMNPTSACALKFFLKIIPLNFFWGKMLHSDRGIDAPIFDGRCMLHDDRGIDAPECCQNWPTSGNYPALKRCPAQPGSGKLPSIDVWKVFRTGTENLSADPGQSCNEMMQFSYEQAWGLDGRCGYM